MEKILKIQRRFFRKEKNQFLEAVEEKLTEYGYVSERRAFQGLIFKSENLETKCDKPEYIFIAHYDTGVTMPFWFHPLSKLFGANSIAFIAAFFILFLTLEITSIHWHVISYWKIIFGISFLSILFPNKKNFNDNTSGVIALLQLAKKFKENGIDNVKFIFVDNEEWGLFGSKAHRKHLEKEKLILPQCKVISIDCVGGGGEIPLVTQNGKSEYAEFFQKEIQKEFGLCKSEKMTLPFSDNYSFRKYGALNISFVDMAKIPVGYYISNIHSSKDSEINLPKIEKLTDVLTNIIKTVNWRVEDNKEPHSKKDSKMNIVEIGKVKTLIANKISPCWDLGFSSVLRHMAMPYNTLYKVRPMNAGNCPIKQEHKILNIK